ncbi:uncharacterized protein fgfbp1b [Syngnathoides biaculeatus]|uniref:uncharacterized protein fgfbp1b n=1 Tax=Syngnathoides biaculeatus TaxID=300417 RepID=UPI002ADE4F27|nr:uncharacterized protein fgfbp1b [Syngnathoides biaculeatus]
MSDIPMVCPGMPPQIHAVPPTRFPGCGKASVSHSPVLQNSGRPAGSGFACIKSKDFGDRGIDKMLGTLISCFLGLALASREQPGVSPGAPAVVARGEFPYGATMNCTWLARERDEDLVRVLVKCEDPVARVHGGVTDRECHYDGKPRRCPAFRSDPRGFWKQLGRSFRRLGSGVCSDDDVLVKARVCKRAPRDSHFKLDIFSSVASAQSGGVVDRPPAWNTPVGNRTAACPEARRKAEMFCSPFWANLCTSFLSILHSDC